MTDEDAFLPLGPMPGADARAVTGGVLIAVDETTRTCQVSIAEGDGAWMPFLGDAPYSELIGSRVWVLRDIITGRAVLCLGMVGSSVIPAPPSEVTALPVTGTVTATSPLTVTADGQTYECQSVVSYTPRTVADVVLLYWPTPSTPWVLGQVVGAFTPPSAPSTPTGLTLTRAAAVVTVEWTKASGSTSSDVRWSTNGGASWQVKTGLTGVSTTVPIAQGQTVTVQVRATGPGGVSAWSSSSSTTWAKPAPPPPVTVTKTVTITPTWSGTYRAGYGWDRWNINRAEYGGRSTLYQGDKYGSGDVEGLATYGSRITSLAADEITKIEVTLRGANQPGDHPSFTVQGAPHGSKPGGAPSSSGATASGTPGRTSAVKVELPSGLREALRTGSARGLLLVGSGYGAVRGTSAADGMALKITYTRTV